MQFNIEISIEHNLSIKLQVMRNTISVYFNGEDTLARVAMNNWKHLDSHFLPSISDYNGNWVRGPDAPHIKRNHTNDYETLVVHLHREFHTEITPEIFAYYLVNFCDQKNSHSKKYQALFSESPETIIKAFEDYYEYYYKECRGKNDERMFEEEHRLTEDEHTLYERAVKWQTGKKPLLSKLCSSSVFNKKKSETASSNKNSENDFHCSGFKL